MIRHGYPLSLDLGGRKCVVVGGGAEAALRIGNLLEAGADVLLVAEEDVPGLGELRSSRLRIERRAFEAKDLQDAWLVVQATQDEELASRVASLCHEQRLFFCAIDQPKNSSYSHMALARAGSLTLAVGTEGRAPSLGRRLREELSRVLDEADAAQEVERLAALREATPPAERRQVLTRAVSEVHLTGSLHFRKS